MYRIGIIALLHESNTFIQVPTTLEHFKSNLLSSGDGVLHSFRNANHEVGGFIEVLEQAADAIPIGIFAARAMPYGTISKECWDSLMMDLDRQLQGAGILDGLLVAPHGATVSEEHPDADGYWLAKVRTFVGKDVPILGTLDLHANVTQRMIDSTDAIFGYRTNPHLDQKQRGIKAAQTLLAALRGECKPVQAFIPIPLCVNIERQATAEEQGMELGNEVDRIENEESQRIDISCFYGFPYADVPQMGASVVAVSMHADSMHGREVAQKTTRSIAEFWWNRRKRFEGVYVSIEQAIEMVIEHRQVDSSQPLGLLDMGDNVGGGSPGDGTSIAHQWWRKPPGKLLTVIADPKAVEQSIQTGVGGSWHGEVGGKTDPVRHGLPLIDTYRVRRLSDGIFQEPNVRHGGYSQFDQGNTAVLEGESGITVIATTLRVPPLSLHQVLSQGIDLSEYAAIVIKGVHAPVAAYQDVCSKLIRVNTLGVTTADIMQLNYTARRKPMEPFEPTSFDMQ